MLSQLQIPENSRKKRKRLGRGHGSTLGKTSGRGHKHLKMAFFSFWRIY